MGQLAVAVLHVSGTLSHKYSKARANAGNSGRAVTWLDFPAVHGIGGLAKQENDANQLAQVCLGIKKTMRAKNKRTSQTPKHTRPQLIARNQLQACVLLPN